MSDSRHPLIPGTSSSLARAVAMSSGAVAAVSLPQCCLLVAAELWGRAGLAPLDIPVIACVNSLPWNSFSEDGPPWGKV